MYIHFRKLNENSVSSILFATSWFMTLYSSVLNFHIFLRIMDIFWLEKNKIIYRIALAILKIIEDDLLQ